VDKILVDQGMTYLEVSIQRRAHQSSKSVRPTMWRNTGISWFLVNAMMIYKGEWFTQG